MYFLGMRASVHVDLPGWAAEGLEALKSRCEELSLQPRGTRGESGGQTGKQHMGNNKVLESVMCDVIKIRLKRRYEKRSGKGNP